MCYVEYAGLAEWVRGIRGHGMKSHAEPPAGRRVRIDLADLAEAFDDASWEVSTFLDLDTGNVIRIAAEVRAELEALYTELPEELVNLKVAEQQAGASAKVIQTASDMLGTLIDIRV